MPHSSDSLLALLVAFASAHTGGELARRLRLPSVVGEIAAGCLVGPYALGWLSISEPLEVFAELGAVLLLFSVGLETRLGDLKAVGRMAFAVGSAGVALPFALGGGWAHWTGYRLGEALFIGATFVATSAGITARVLQELKVLERIESRVILGAAVIDDILAMLLLGVVTSLETTGSVELLGLATVVLQALMFIGLIAFFGTAAMRRSSDLMDRPATPLAPLVLCLAGCLALAGAAAYIGLAAIIGAFLAGMVAAESKQRRLLEEQIQPILALIVPFFFVLTGAKVDLAQLTGEGMLLTTLLVTGLAVFSKFIACALASAKLGRVSSAIIGVGMIPRGEVGIIVASLGLQAGVFGAAIYSVIVVMSLATSIIAPPLLRPLFRRAAAA